MRTKLLIMAIAMLATQQLKAQITLTEASYATATLAGTDSLKKTTHSSTLPPVAAALDATWDFSAVTDSTPVFYKYKVPAISPYTFADSNTYSFSSFNYQGSVLSSVVVGGYQEYGLDIKAEAYSLPTSSTDSIFIPNQTPLYTSPRTAIAFPATINSSWTSDYSSDFAYQISYFPAYHHTDGIVRSFYSEQDTVTGWGKVRVKTNTGAPSGYMNVLQVRSTVIRMDSFLLAGTPAPAILLGSLMLTQGQKDTIYTLIYYRAGETTPLVSIDMKDAAFTQPNGATYHRQRLPSTAGVGNVAGAAAVTVYPNPVTGNTVALQLPALAGSWSYELIGVDGKIVATGGLQVSGTQAQLTLPAAATQGIYYIRLMNDGSTVSVKAIDIAR